MCNDTATLFSQSNELLTCWLAKNTVAPPALSQDLLGFPMIHLGIRATGWGSRTALSWVMPTPCCQILLLLLFTIAFYLVPCLYMLLSPSVPTEKRLCLTHICGHHSFSAVELLNCV